MKKARARMSKKEFEKLLPKVEPTQDQGFKAGMVYN